MKYKVSLLPEKNRKRIIGKRKAEKGRGIANVVMLVLLAVAFIAICGKIYADSKLEKIQAMNAEYEQKVTALQEYRNINTALNNKIQLIEKIQVNEPALYNFLASFSNVDHAGVSVTNISCVDWKTSRICTITGTATSRDAFNVYLNKLNEIEGVKNVACTSYTVTVVNGGEMEAQFSVTITCEGGVAVVVPETTTAATEETTLAE